ncbi:hypothetical protein K493DRAFT_311268 [Basidiobolus meristosporus CBS 931.73]|uniref:IMS import disulfide relay-system CHCH-CHCH-like Cx9C domain-containing protein n=1 Tax=Basidiobolus meristosporus CBS 931.73 TaxID=1314790 RepID=A0A1Y1Z4G8_9FUNG|nr:hypothetical protein K493DRAFT_311268 [Basidiobolus meristosporus CBS 931.73]|eukprot:ORY04725.1 hypothetical protein K493DRAFT_311268 [Basidiobolus meristosporus CBS 931.73]
MDNTLEEVVKYCGLQLEMYQRCVESNPTNWESACFKQKQALTKCSEENVEALRVPCLKDNQQEPEKCLESLKQLYECTQEAHDAYLKSKETPSTN